MNSASFERWAADYVKTIAWEGEAEGSRRKRQYDKVVAERADALRFLAEHGHEVSLDEIAGDPPEISLLIFTSPMGTLRLEHECRLSTPT